MFEGVKLGLGEAGKCHRPTAAAAYKRFTALHITAPVTHTTTTGTLLTIFYCLPLVNFYWPQTSQRAFTGKQSNEANHHVFLYTELCKTRPPKQNFSQRRNQAG